MRKARVAFSATISIQATAGDPAAAHITFLRGGHNYRNYASYLAPALVCSATGWAARLAP